MHPPPLIDGRVRRARPLVDGRVGPALSHLVDGRRHAPAPLHLTVAHLFLNHVLDPDEAFKNFSFLGYQQPLNDMTPEAVIGSGETWSHGTPVLARLPPDAVRVLAPAR